MKMIQKKNSLEEEQVEHVYGDTEVLTTSTLLPIQLNNVQVFF